MPKTTQQKSNEVIKATAGDVEISFRPYRSDKLLGFASVTFYDELIVNDCRIYEGKEEPFLAFPSEKGKDGKYYNKVYITKESELNEHIAAALKKLDL